MSSIKVAPPRTIVTSARSTTAAMGSTYRPRSIASVTLFASVRLVRQLNAMINKSAPLDRAAAAVLGRRRPPLPGSRRRVPAWTKPTPRPWSTPSRASPASQSQGLAAGPAGPRTARHPARAGGPEPGRVGRRIRGDRTEWWGRPGPDRGRTSRAVAPLPRGAARIAAQRLRGGARLERDHPERRADTVARSTSRPDPPPPPTSTWGPLPGIRPGSGPPPIAPPDCFSPARPRWITTGPVSAPTRPPPADASWRSVRDAARDALVAAVSWPAVNLSAHVP